MPGPFRYNYADCIFMSGLRLMTSGAGMSLLNCRCDNPCNAGDFQGQNIFLRLRASFSGIWSTKSLRADISPSDRE